MSVTRISKLKGFPDILAGRDLAKIFKDGHVYQFMEIMGEIMVKDLGEYAMPDDPTIHTDFTGIMKDGTYMLTKEEKKKC